MEIKIKIVIDTKAGGFPRPEETREVIKEYMSLPENILSTVDYQGRSNMGNQAHEYEIKWVKADENQADGFLGWIANANWIGWKIGDTTAPFGDATLELDAPNNQDLSYVFIWVKWNRLK